MKTSTITSTSNSRVKLWASLADARSRRDERLFLAEGPNLLAEAKNAGLSAITVLLDSSRFTTPPEYLPATDEIVWLTPSVFNKISSVETAQGVTGVFQLPEDVAPTPGTGQYHVLVAFSIQDPGNLGALMRVAVGAGFDCLVSVKPAADIYSPKTVRAAAGTIFTLPTFAMTEAEFAAFLVDNNIAPIATVMKEGSHYMKYDYPSRLALLIGSEGEGLPESWMQNPASCVHIPMARTLESLNASVAAGIIAFSIAAKAGR